VFSIGVVMMGAECQSTILLVDFAIRMREAAEPIWPPRCRMERSALLEAMRLRRS
jgi:hypothetical protein